MITNDQRAKAIQAGWVYSNGIHPIIGIDYAVREQPNGIEIMFEDKVKYSPDEMLILKNHGGLRKDIHIVKRIFKGVVVQ